MLLRLAFAAAFALAALIGRAEAQQTQVVTDCVGVVGQPSVGGRLNTDQFGRLCIVGSLASVPSGAATAGIAPQTTMTSSLVAKSTAGNLYGYHATFGGTAGFVAFLNASTVPAAGAAISPVECVPISTNTSTRTRQDIPDRYSVGIVLVATSSCTTYTAVTPTLMAASVQ